MYDYFNVFVIDGDILCLVYFLYFVDQVRLYGKWLFDVQDVVWCSCIIRQWSVCVNEVIFLYQDVFGKIDQVFMFLIIFCFDYYFVVILFDFIEGDYIVDFRNYCRVGWVMSFEKFCYLWQIIGDIGDFIQFMWNFGNFLIGVDCIFFINREVRVYWQVIIL